MCGACCLVIDTACAASKDFYVISFVCAVWCLMVYADCDANHSSTTACTVDICSSIMFCGTVGMLGASCDRAVPLS